MNDSFMKILLALFAILGFIGGLYGATLLLITCLFFIFIILLTRYWNKYAFSRLKIQKTLSKSKSEFGESLYYIVQFENNKLLPLIWLRFEDLISMNIEFVANDLLTKSLGRNLNILKDNLSLKWFEKVRKKYEIIPQKRGVYNFGEGSIYFDGILGLYHNRKNISRQDRLIVYPKIVPLKFFDIKESQIFGTAPQKGWIYKDPLNKVGVKPYQTNDSIKDINWKASARHMQLKSNIYKPSLRKELHIFLNKPSRELQQNSDNILELGIICAASLVDYGFKADFSVGFYSNLMPAREYTPNFTNIDADKNVQQREKILTALAVLRGHSVKGLDYLIKRKLKDIDNGASIVIITYGINKNLEKLIFKFNQFFNLTVIRLGEKAKNKELKGIKELYIKGEKTWDEIKSLEFTK